MGERFEISPWYAALGAATLSGLVLWLSGQVGLAEAALGLATAIVAGRFARMLASGRFTVDLLMAVVGAVTLLHGAVFEGLVVLLLYSAAEVVEELVESLAKKRIVGLGGLIPRRVLVERGDGWREAGIEDLRRGDVILVRVGEAFPADSIALSKGSVDLSIVSGEPLPVRVEPGTLVPSGAVVVEGPVKARVAAEPGESFAQRLARLAEEALERKARTTRLLERLTPHITVAVLASYALAHVLLDPLRGLTLLLVGCPSAFIISSSYATSLAIAFSARRGALIGGGEVLEKLWRPSVVVLDKTGTLTVLEPESIEVRGGDPGSVVERIAAAARASRHPVARALARLAPTLAVEEVREKVGEGLVSGSLTITAGPTLECGKTVLARVDGSEALVCLRERPAPGARELVEYLKRRGVRVVIASGDSVENVARIAGELGVDEYYGGMRPEDKARLVESLKRQGTVVFVGDGVNDAPALAAADVGIAVGDIDIARRVADAAAPAGAWQVLEILKAGESHRRALAASFTVAAIVKAAAGVGGLAGALSLPIVALLGDDGSTLAGVASATLAWRGRR